MHLTEEKNWNSIVDLSNRNTFMQHMNTIIVLLSLVKRIKTNENKMKIFKKKEEKIK